jgi:hypothetical protein
MTALNILAAVFIMAALYGRTKRRFQHIVALVSLAAAIAMMGLAAGIDGVIYSLAGAAIALFFTVPLSILGVVSRCDVVVSVALGAALGGVRFAAVYGTAIAFLLLQKLLRIDTPTAGAEGALSVSPSGAGLLAMDEKSALVEIEAMKMLRRDTRRTDARSIEEYMGGETDPSGDGPWDRFPWCAKLALATLMVLMSWTSL